MSDRIVPFLSSSPPPFDDDRDFKFDDYDGFYGGNCINEDSRNGVTSEIDGVSSNALPNENKDSTGFDPERKEAQMMEINDDDFNDFLNYQTAHDKQVERAPNGLKGNDDYSDKGQSTGLEESFTKVDRTDSKQKHHQLSTDDVDTFTDFDDFVSSEHGTLEVADESAEEINDFVNSEVVEPDEIVSLDLLVDESNNLQEIQESKSQSLETADETQNTEELNYGTNLEMEEADYFISSDLNVQGVKSSQGIQELIPDSLETVNETLVVLSEPSNNRGDIHNNDDDVDDDDDDDDDETLSSSKQIASECHPSNSSMEIQTTNDSVKGDDDDEFDSFLDHSEETVYVNIPPNAGHNDRASPSNDDSWAQFETFPESCSVGKADEYSTTDGDEIDDDFGGFEKADNESVKLNLADSFQSSMLEAFHKSERTVDCVIKNLTTILNPSNGERSGNRCNNIWRSIRSVEQTPALTMQWKSSNIFNSFLKTLNISPQTKVPSHSPNVPVFAMNLGLLEPKRLHENEHIESREGTKSNDVPKVEFDWANSVLVDPLDAGNISHLDLDFFTDETFSYCVSQASKNEKELLDSLEPSHNDPQKSLSLDTLLATMTSNNITLIKSSDDPSVSPRVKVILDQIPDLSFMHAKVLMFPLREEFVTN